VSSRRDAFTLIELLIVVVIIGILAAIAIPKFATSKQKAYVTSMRSDLRNLETAEEAYFFDNQTYADPNSLISSASYHMSAGNSVSASTILNNGWTVSVTNTFVPATASPHVCAVWVGGATKPFASDSVEGSPGCQ
jgi:type IV pilus assembly protein PilA